MVEWHHWLNGHEFEKTPIDSEGQGSLVCYSPWGHRVRHGLATEQQQIQSDCPCKKRKSGHTETHLRCTCMRKDPVSLFSQGEGGEKVDILNHGEGSQKKPDPSIP